jgi:hypothetical protein
MCPVTCRYQGTYSPSSDRDVNHARAQIQRTDTSSL